MTLKKAKLLFFLLYAKLKILFNTIFAHAHTQTDSKDFLIFLAFRRSGDHNNHNKVTKPQYFKSDLLLYILIGYFQSFCEPSHKLNMQVC